MAGISLLGPRKEALMIYRRSAVAALLLCLPLATAAAGPGDVDFVQRSKPMMKFVIERDLPGAGKLSSAELQAISQKSRDVLRGMGPRIQWVESYVTDDKIYCVYVAESEAEIRKHGEVGGFPVSRISRISTMIDPSTAEAPVIWP
jgi:Protein of unknown function (DUF4242)